VDALDPVTSAPPEEDGGIVSIWSGNDPREFAVLKEALDKAGIPFIGPVSTAYFIFPSMRPRMEVGVSAADRERAEKVLAELEPVDEHDDFTPEEAASLAPPESEGAEPDEVADVPIEDPGDWDDQEPASEVWNGDDEEFANTMTACFRENGIPSHKFTEAGRCRLVVRPEQEARAKEIIREVVEGRPLE
jgi:hypothetical protein